MLEGIPASDAAIESVRQALQRSYRAHGYGDSGGGGDDDDAAEAAVAGA